MIKLPSLFTVLLIIIMITATQTKKIVFSTLTSLALATLLTACSDDKAETKGNSFDHAHKESVTDVEKHRFEHEFTKQCVARELKASPNQNKDGLDETCMCIAKHMLGDLTAVEADKFLKEKKNTQSMRIRFDEAAYDCLQENNPPQAPKLFGKPKA